MNAEMTKFHIPESAPPSQSEEAGTYAAQNPQNNTVESAPEAHEIPQVANAMFRIGDYLQEYRGRKLASSQENTAFSGLRRIFSQQKTPHDLIREEVRATSGMFSPETATRQYVFFYFGKGDDNSHEWVLQEGEEHGKEEDSLTTRYWYLVHPHTVYRSQEGQRYREIPEEEMKRLWKATNKYYNIVRETVYS